MNARTQDGTLAFREPALRSAQSALPAIGITKQRLRQMESVLLPVNSVGRSLLSTPGLPYGQDLLIPIWVSTMAVRQRSRIIRFSAASEVIDFFHLFKDGKRYHRIMEGFQRIFAATIFFE
ncbi:MAG TPA: hypothetical protein VGY31_00885 [Terriglobia bacterium]|nr:hypothetical protein [Terriglobia bacterium]